MVLFRSNDHECTKSALCNFIENIITNLSWYRMATVDWINFFGERHVFISQSEARHNICVWSLAGTFTKASPVSARHDTWMIGPASTVSFLSVLKKLLQAYIKFYDNCSGSIGLRKVKQYKKLLKFIAIHKFLVYVRLSLVISSKNASLSQFTLQSSFDIIASMVHREKLW